MTLEGCLIWNLESRSVSVCHSVAATWGQKHRINKTKRREQRKESRCAQTEGRKAEKHDGNDKARPFEHNSMPPLCGSAA